VEAEQPDFLRTEQIDAAVFARELIDKASALAPRVWRLDHAAEGTFNGDRHRLTGVMNLAQNAVHHTGEEDTIAIGIDLSDDEYSVWVRDTGTGISVSDQARIFERFTRGRDAYRQSLSRRMIHSSARSWRKAFGRRATPRPWSTTASKRNTLA
jgi:signal transduction histidine kinase